MGDVRQERGSARAGELREANPGRGCPGASEQPRAGEGSVHRDTPLFCPLQLSGKQGKQEGARRFPVFVPRIFSLRSFFLPLFHGLCASNKCKEGVDCKRPLRHNYFTIIAFTGRACRAIFLLHPLHFNLSFTFFFFFPQQALARFPSLQQKPR